MNKQANFGKDGAKKVKPGSLAETCGYKSSGTGVLPLYGILVTYDFFLSDRKTSNRL